MKKFDAKIDGQKIEISHEKLLNFTQTRRRKPTSSRKEVDEIDKKNKQTSSLKEVNEIDKEALSDENVNKSETFMAYTDFEYMIDNKCGKFFEPSTLLLEFYYLLLTQSYNLAVRMLNNEYADNLKNNLNKIFLEDDDKLLR